MPHLVPFVLIGIVCVIVLETVVNTVDIFDSSTNTWSTAQLTVARSYIGANSLLEQNQVFFAGGYMGPPGMFPNQQFISFIIH